MDASTRSPHKPALPAFRLRASHREKSEQSNSCSRKSQQRRSHIKAKNLLLPPHGSQLRIPPAGSRPRQEDHHPHVAKTLSPHPLWILPAVQAPMHLLRPVFEHHAQSTRAEKPQRARVLDGDVPANVRCDVKDTRDEEDEEYGTVTCEERARPQMQDVMADEGGWALEIVAEILMPEFPGWCVSSGLFPFSRFSSLETETHPQNPRMVYACESEPNHGRSLPVSPGFTTASTMLLAPRMTCSTQYKSTQCPAASTMRTASSSRVTVVSRVRKGSRDGAMWDGWMLICTLRFIARRTREAIMTSVRRATIERREGM